MTCPLKKPPHQLNKIDIVPHQCMPEALVITLRPEEVNVHLNFKLLGCHKLISFDDFYLKKEHLLVKRQVCPDYNMIVSWQHGLY